MKHHFLIQKSRTHMVERNIILKQRNWNVWSLSLTASNIIYQLPFTQSILSMMAQWHKLANLTDIPRTYLYLDTSLLHKVFVERLNRSMTRILQILCHTVNLLTCVKYMWLTHSHHHRRNLPNNTGETKSTTGSRNSHASSLCPIKLRILFFPVFTPPK